MPDRGVPDRWADAARARRRELRAVREQLVGGHRGELRRCLALSRLAAAGHAAAALAELRGEAAEQARRGDRAVRERLPALVGAAVVAVAGTVAARWAAELGPPLRRIATERGLQMEPGWPVLPAARRPDLPPDVPSTEAPSAVPVALGGLVEGAAFGRLVLLPLAALPLFGLPALGGPTLAPLAVGAALTAVAVATRSRRTAAQRARMLRRAERVVTAAAAAITGDLDRRLVEIEHSAGAALDTAVLRRRAVVDRELALLTSSGSADG